MDLKYWAIIAMFGGGATVLFALARSDMPGEDRLPITLGLTALGAFLVFGGITYLLYRGFMAL